jgi:beta-lactamase class A
MPGNIFRGFLILTIISLSGVIVFLGNRIYSLSQEGAYRRSDMQLESRLDIQNTQDYLNANNSTQVLSSSGSVFSDNISSEKKTEIASGLKNSRSDLENTNQEQIQSSANSTDTTDIDQDLKQKTESILGDNIGKYSVYYHNLKTGKKFEINGDTIRPPASISKFPSAILTLKSIQDGEYDWTTTIQLDPNLKYIPEDPMYAYQNWGYYNVKDYIYNVIVGSDNTAMRHLERLHGGTEAYRQKLSEKTGIKLVRQPHEVLARDVGYAFEGIYNQSFLNKENNDYLINLMSISHKWNSDRLILAMSPYPEAKVVHKIGQVTTTGGVSYHDAGIIYGPKEDFVLVVLNEDTTPSDGITKIIDISRMIYEQTNR